MENQNANGIKITLEKKAFRRRLATYKYKNLQHKDLTSFFNEAETIFVRQAKDRLGEFHSLKANFVLHAKFHRKFSTYAKKDSNESNKNDEIDDNSDDIADIKDFFLSTKMKELHHSTDLNEWFKTNIVCNLMAQVDGIQEMGSVLYVFICTV